MSSAVKPVLIVEDDPSVILSIEEVLGAEGIGVQSSRSGREAITLLKEQDIDLVIIDLGLPDLSGFDILRTLEKNRRFGAIVVTARHDVIDAVLSLELGADDYIVKPFEPREFVARVRSVLRRYSIIRSQGQDPPTSFTFGRWVFDPSVRTVKCAGEKPVKLTAVESRLLRIFIENPNQILTRDRLLDLLHPSGSEIPYDRSIDVTITRLRRKIEQNARRPHYIKTAHGDGYLFSPKGE